MDGITVKAVEDIPAYDGEHTIRTRATDATGAVQPDHQPLHPYGVLWQSVIPHPIVISG